MNECRLMPESHVPNDCVVSRRLHSRKYRDRGLVKLMSFSGVLTLRLTVAAAACSALLPIAASSASAAPATDSRGYVDSTARCAATAVLFGSTETARGDLQDAGRTV